MSRERSKKKQAELLATLPFVTPYDRPMSFADPGGDWLEEHAARVLNTPDAELGWWEFRAIFQVGLPLASYHQGVYFAPFAFKHLKERRENHLEYTSALVWFLSHHKQMLCSDQLMDDVEAAFRDCLSHWTGKFEVIHFDKAACAAKGWGLAYQDYVNGTETVIDLLENLVHYDAFAGVAIRFIETLSIPRRNPIQSAWFLEYASEYKKRNMTQRGLKKHYISITKAPIPVLEQPLLEKHAEIVIAAMVSKEQSPTYWNDTFAWLGL
jgi:hypothetical protein